jgi:tetratricopeptide (TPR) repeat protein
MNKLSNAIGFLKVLILTSLMTSSLFAISGRNQNRDFSFALEKFVNGDVITAEAIVDNHLELGIDDRYLHANFLFLKARLQGKHPDKQQEAIDGFLQARHLFEEQDATREVFSTDTGLARIYLNENRMIEAEDLLINNLIVGEELHYPLGDTYRLLGTLAFIQGDYERALAYNESGLGAYSDADDPHGLPLALARQGLLFMLVGDWQAGLEKTLHGQTLSVANGDQLSYAHSLISMVVYHRYHGLDERILVAQIEALLGNVEDIELRDLLQFSLDTSFLTESMDPPIPPDEEESMDPPIPPDEEESIDPPIPPDEDDEASE